MFKRIKEKFKQRSGSKVLDEILKLPLDSTSKKKGIVKVGCLVNLEEFDKTKVFHQLLDDFSLRPNAIKIIGYKSFYDTNSPYATPVFSDKDLGWKGEIENSYVLEFLSREYDVLLNYYTQENLILNLMSVKTRARIRVGFKQVDTRFNDIIIDNPLDDFKTFKTELKKYLIVLNEIKK